jgi:hypothetical protein
MQNRPEAPTPETPIPLGQRLFDNVFLLLEITSLPQGRLP